MGRKEKFKRELRKEIMSLINSVSVQSRGLDFVDAQYNGSDFTLLGCGCSSAVFRSRRFPHIAVKVYSPEYHREVLGEVLAYKKVAGLSWFPCLYLYGRSFLAIEYIEGESLYNCLIKGIAIPQEVIGQVDEAIMTARERGLVPSDVHFKNIIVRDEQVILIDLSDYLTAKHVSRWDRLKFFYKTVYRPLLMGAKIPKPVVDFSRKGYKCMEKLFNR